MVNYAPSGLWSVRVRESEKVLLEASDVIGEVQRYWEALYAKRPVNLPAFERLVRAHIPKGVPEEWRSVQDYTLQEFKDAVRQAVADDKAPGSNWVRAALIAELPEPVQGLLVHVYRAILRGADVPESWHEAIIWLMPKGTATGNLDEYRPIAHDSPHAEVHSCPGTQGTGCGLAVRSHARLHGGCPGVPGPAQAAAWAGGKPRPGLRFDTAPHGALALLLRHIGVPEELIRLFHTLSCGLWCAASPRTARRRAFGSTGACSRAVRRALCSTSSSWSLSCGASPARRGEMLAMRCHPWCRRTVMTSC